MAIKNYPFISCLFYFYSNHSHIVLQGKDQKIACKCARDFSFLIKSISFLPNYPKYTHSIFVNIQCSSKPNPTGSLPQGCCHHKPSGTLSAAAALW